MNDWAMFFLGICTASLIAIAAIMTTNSMTNRAWERYLIGEGIGTYEQSQNGYYRFVLINNEPTE